jgi:hypothetical protein
MEQRNNYCSYQKEHNELQSVIDVENTAGVANTEVDCTLVAVAVAEAAAVVQK